MKNNPIFYNDTRGDTISYRGSQRDTQKVIKTYVDQLGTKNVKMKKYYDSKGQLTGVNIYKASKVIASSGSNAVNDELINVINSGENTRIFKVTTDPTKITELQIKGGMLSVDNSYEEGRKAIKEYTGNGKFKRYIFVSDKFFDNNQDSGSYLFIERQTSMWVDDERRTRYIPFNEGIFHETIHQSFSLRNRSFASYYMEENAVMSIVNKWQVEHGFHERGLYFLYQPSWFAILMGKKSDYIINPFMYDDYINENNTGGVYDRGEKRKNTPNKIGKEYD